MKIADKVVCMFQLSWHDLYYCGQVQAYEKESKKLLDTIEQHREVINQYMTKIRNAEFQLKILKSERGQCVRVVLAVVAHTVLMLDVALGWCSHSRV